MIFPFPHPLSFLPLEDWIHVKTDLWNRLYWKTLECRLIVSPICTLNNKLVIHDVESKDQVSIEHFFSKSNITSDWKRKIEIKLFIQSIFASGSHLMGIIRFHLMIDFLTSKALTSKYVYGKDVRHTGAC